jgi:hypothetical protein
MLEVEQSFSILHGLEYQLQRIGEPSRAGKTAKRASLMRTIFDDERTMGTGAIAE